MTLYSSIPHDMRPPRPRFSAVPPDLRPKPVKRVTRTGFLGLPASQALMLAAHGASHSSLPGTRPPAGGSSNPSAQDSGFYPFDDYYGGLLTKLATMRDLAMGNLSTDLESRSKNIQGIVDAARGPLNLNYSRAEQEAAAVNDAVANRLHSQGDTAATDLRSQLASLGQDPTAATADLSKYYAGTGGANYALDSGDVQRLIGRQAEENALLNKQPALIRQQMESDLAGNQNSIISDYLNRAYDLSGQQAQVKSQYQKDKFGFEQTQKATTLDAENVAEKQYWDNYWNKQDLLFKRWQTQIASGDKSAALKTQKEIADAKTRSASEVANIRANASAYGADVRAGATVTAAKTRADATKAAAATRAGSKANTSSNVGRQRAYKAALDAIIDPKSGVIRGGVNPTGYNADWTMTRIVNGVLKSYGINPQSPQGKAVIASVLSQANGRKFAKDKTTTYKYDPNWVKGAKKAAQKRNRGK